MAFDEFDDTFESAFCAVIERLQPLGIKKLSKEQKKSLRTFCKGQDTLAVLPTGHGKSLIYQMAVLMAREMKRYKPIVVVISPLKSLIADQIRECERFGLSSIKLEESSIAFLRNECKVDVLFASAEVFDLYDSKLLLMSLCQRLIGIVVDESHCVVKWGLQDAPFRAAYGKIGNVRGFVHCPVLCLTATAGKLTRTRLLKALHMRDVSLVKVTPDKPNSILAVRKASVDIEQDFNWLLHELREKRLDCPRVIVYCKTISSCGELFSMLMQELDDSFHDMFAMFHSKTPDDIQKNVLASLVDPHGMLRVVFATSALGMGVNLPNIRHIIHYGVPRDVEEYLQEVGRGGRDGEKFNATVIYRPWDLAHCDQTMHNFVCNPNNECRRKIIMESFQEKVLGEKNSVFLECCDVCNASAGISTHTVKFEPCAQSLSLVSRSVDEEEKKLLREILLENVCSNTSATSMFGIGGLLIAVDTDIVEDLVSHSQYVFSAKYLLDNHPILSVELAQKILSIFNEVFGDIEEPESMQFVENINSDTPMARLPDWCTSFEEDDECNDFLLSSSINTYETG